jgi:hypothetical protein
MERSSSEWFQRLLRASSRSAFRRAYKRVQLDPQKYMEQLRRRMKRPIHSWGDLRRLSDEELKLQSDDVIRSSAKLAALEGMGLGLGGLLTTLPDFGILAAITVRMLQKLSLTYGFEYSTDEELASLWLAAASAAGLDFGREFVEKQALERVIPKIVDQVALRAGAEVAEKWAARLVPILSAGTAAALNYWFVRSWGRRAQQHFLERRRSLRLPEETGPYLLPSTSEG